MKRILVLLVLVVASLSACATTPGHHRVGALGPPIFQIVYSDPSTGNGLAAAVGTIVQLSGGTAAWQKTGTSSTAWTAIVGGAGGGVPAVRGASTSNITLSGAQTVDGVALIAGDRELVAGQTDATTDGIYVVASGAWARSTDTIASGMLVAVTQGTVYAGTTWILTTQAPITVGTTALAFSQVAAQGTGFGSNTSILQPDSASSTVTTLNLQNNFVNNTHGTATTNWLMTFLVAGASVVNDLASLNGAGRQSVTIASGTPTIAWNPRADELKITYGVDASKTVITGLDLDTDGGYDIEMLAQPTGAAEVDLKLNDSDNTGGVNGYYISGGVWHANQPNKLMLTDGTNQFSVIANLRSSVAGAVKMFMVTMQITGGGTLYEQYMGNSTLTANVTSVSIPTIKAGSVIVLRRVRAGTN